MVYEFPWQLEIVEQDYPIQLIFTKDDQAISYCQFYDIDNAMPFIMSFSDRELIIKNAYYLKRLLNKSKYTWHFYARNPNKIARARTAAYMDLPVELAMKMTGATASSINNIRSNANAD